MKATLALATALLLAACVPVKTRYWDDAPAKLKAGDVVRVETREGKRHVFRVTRFDETAFFGIASNQIEYRVPFKVVKQLWTRKTDTEWVEVVGPGLPACCGIFY
jgi:hypothetical protein